MVEFNNFGSLGIWFLKSKQGLLNCLIGSDILAIKLGDFKGGILPRVGINYFIMKINI